MPKDIVIDVDLENFKIGDLVSGNNSSGEEIVGEIVKIDLACPNRFRIQIETQQNTLYWLRTVDYLTE